MPKKPDPNPAAKLVATMDKRRTLPQLERAESQFLDLAPFRNADTEAAFAAVESELSAVAEAIDDLEMAESSDKEDYREAADMAWEDLAEAASELRAAVAKHLGLSDDEDDA
jgi:hypothetical protein